MGIEWKRFKRQIIITIIAVSLPAFGTASWALIKYHFEYKYAIESLEKNKVNKEDFHMKFYEAELLHQKKTMILEGIATANKETILDLKEENQNLDHRINRMIEKQFRMRGITLPDSTN